MFFYDTLQLVSESAGHRFDLLALRAFCRHRDTHDADAVLRCLRFQCKHSQHGHIELPRKNECPDREVCLAVQEVTFDTFAAAKGTVARHADHLAVFQRFVDQKDMRHIFRNGYRANVITFQYLCPVLLYLLSFASVYQTVDPFLLLSQKVAA